MAARLIDGKAVAARVRERVAAEVAAFDALLQRLDYETWRNVPLAAIEDSGQQEMLNWYMLVGAMEALGRKPDECEFIETWSFNSNKCFATFIP